MSTAINSPAHKAGLQEGDLLVAVNRKKIGNIGYFYDLDQNCTFGSLRK